jgi:replicative DNA helicase
MTRKRYVAILDGRLPAPAGVLVHHIERHERTSRIVAVRDDLRTTGAIESFLERAMAEQGAQSVVIDHVGLLADNHGKASEYERVSRISWALKEMALRTGAAVIALSQLNRAVEHRPECIPFMSDLRESGRVEENADAVALLWRRAYYSAKGMTNPDHDKDFIGDLERVVVNLPKNRNGEPGGVELGWNGATMRFHEIDRRAA